MVLIIEATLSALMIVLVIVCFARGSVDNEYTYFNYGFHMLHPFLCIAMGLALYRLHSLQKTIPSIHGTKKTMFTHFILFVVATLLDIVTHTLELVLEL